MPLTLTDLPLKAQEKEEVKNSYTVTATVTAYSSEEGQTDDTPFITANGETVKHGTIACPSMLPFGTKVIILDQEYSCNDRMAKRYRDQHYYDVWVEKTDTAIAFGRKTLLVTIIK